MQLPELFLDLFFPRRCVVCQAEGSWACASCIQEIAENSLRIEHFSLADDLPGQAYFSFELPLVRELLHHLKYNGIYEVTDSFLQLLKLSYQKEDLHFPADAQLLPVPTSYQRLRQRGYNQAELLASMLGSWLGLPVSTSLLSRRSGKSQVGKTALARAESLRSNFLWQGGEGRIERPVILFDDLCTTGSTLRACAEVLKPHLALPLTVICLAKKY